MIGATGVPYKYQWSCRHGHTFIDAFMHAERSFNGMGPSIAWNGSVPIAGSLEDGLAFDWGANAARAVRAAKNESSHAYEIRQSTGIHTYYTPLTSLIAIPRIAQPRITRTHSSATSA